MKTTLQKILTALSLSFIISYSHAQPGTLDSSFGVNGKVSNNFDIPEKVGASGVEIQSDGKIIAIGDSRSDIQNSDFTIVRYLSNGKLDSSFGINGKVTTHFGPEGSISHSFASSVVIQNDSKIIVGGYDVWEGYFKLSRYFANGKLDSSFGINGKVSTKMGTYGEVWLSALALQQDGKILAAGSVDGFCLIQYKPDGNIDSSFGNNGRIEHESDFRSISDLAVLNDGKIILGITNLVDSDSYERNFEINRLLPNGTFDSSFGINGAVITAFNDSLNNNWLSSLAILSNQDIIAAGISYQGGTSKAILAKYKANGNPDSSFGIFGKLNSAFDNISFYQNKIAVQQNGKIVIASSILGRLNSNGIVDSTFGINGIVSNLNPFTDVALQPDGNIITTYMDYPNFSLARFKGDEPTTISLQKNISITEGNSGTTPALFKVVLNKPAATDVFVNYTTKNLNAVAGSDYTAASGTVRIKAGKIKANIVVNVIGDNTREPNERFALVLSSPVNAVLGTIDSVTCTIKNDDPSFALSSSAKEDIITASSIKIHPNPVKDVLTIEGLNASKKSTISIISSTGLTLFKTTATGNIYAWNIKQFPAGTYFIKIESSGKTETIKFVKQ